MNIIQRVAARYAAAMTIRHRQPQSQPQYGTALDGRDRRSAAKLVNKILHPFSKGFYSDEYWKPVQDIRKALERANIDFVISGGNYEKDSRGMPVRKTWDLEVPFFNKNNRPMWLMGVIVASGAGSMEDPLERYDITAYVE